MDEQLDEIVPVIIGVNDERVIIVSPDVHENCLVQQPLEHVFIRFVRVIASEEVLLNEALPVYQSNPVLIYIWKSNNVRIFTNCTGGQKQLRN